MEMAWPNPMHQPQTILLSGASQLCGSLEMNPAISSEPQEAQGWSLFPSLTVEQ